MCGISGVIGDVNKPAISRMIKAQIHRGPDGSGVWSDNDCLATFGHCRLSIIELSNAGHQPMSFADERLWITYNGELFNFKELRLELKGYGHKFISESDTEVVLAAYLQWGPKCVKKFRGMFAFALADKNPPKGWPNFILARDRFGIKPLVYFQNKSQVWFASEIGGLLATNRLKKVINNSALIDYLSVGSIYQPKTIFKNVNALPAGSVMEIRGNEIKLEKYWDIHDQTTLLREKLKYISFHEAKEELSLLLKDAAKYNMVSDVPVGSFLSGGIDSTAVTGLMGEVSKSKIKAFSVGFESQDNNIDEIKYARVAAKYLGCEIEEILVSSSNLIDLFPKIISDIDQPSIDGTNTWLVSRATRRLTKVAISGLGGDELFAGYGHFGLLDSDTISKDFSKLYIKKVNRPNS